MAFPFALAAAGIPLIQSLFKKKHNTFDLPDDPNFFGPEYERTRALVKQQIGAQYGTGLNDVRERLASAGIRGPGGAADAATRLSVAQGSDVAGAEAGLAGQELGAENQFKFTKYGTEVDRNKLDFLVEEKRKEALIGGLSKIGGAAGKLYGLSKTKDIEADTLIPQSGPLSLGQARPGVLNQDDEQSNPRKLLKFLFGF